MYSPLTEPMDALASVCVSESVFARPLVLYRVESCQVAYFK